MVGKELICPSAWMCVKGYFCVSHINYYAFLVVIIQGGTAYQNFSHTDVARTREQAVQPQFRDEAQARRIAAAVLQPGIVQVRGKEIPMPDPALLLQRYSLPLVNKDTV